MKLAQNALFSLNTMDRSSWFTFFMRSLFWAAERFLLRVFIRKI